VTTLASLLHAIKMPEEQLWSKKAERRFALQLLPDQAWLLLSNAVLSILTACSMRCILLHASRFCTVIMLMLIFEQFESLVLDSVWPGSRPTLAGQVAGILHRPH
jgi:hypothetical protein